jgi:hypothetical protein
MQKYTVSVITLAALLVGLTSTWSHANDTVLLSDVDEQAYQEAYSSWKHLADIQEEAGLPPLGDPPERKEFIGIAAQRAEGAEHDAIAREEAESRWQKRINDAKPHLRTLVRPGETKRADDRSTLARKEKERLMHAADEKWTQRGEVEKELNEIAARHDVERIIEIGESRRATLAGELNGEPIWVTPQNQIAAASISADELWPTNVAPWPSASTGLGLTGTNILLGMWEAVGAVRTTHSEFQGRVIQADGASALDTHATSVAGTMSAGGVFLFSSPATGRLMRGVAYQADVDAYDLANFPSETYDATAGTTNQPGLRLANNSWGLVNAWRQQSFSYFQGTNLITVTNGWVWYGPLSTNYVEDPKFGMYLDNIPEGYGCAQLDTFLSTNATRHLLVYAAGNDRFSGPQTAPPVYYVIIGSSLFIFNNPSANERDWRSGDGDTYGFDTMAAPGTAKNVLTVGSVRDVFHTVGSQTNWGYATNSTVTLSSFSACGPTDDGRIKPDIVAVGEANPAARNFPIVTPGASADNSAVGQQGTSFAAPGVTAGLGLALQRRSQLFTNLTEEADALRGSTLKALAIHTADDIANPGPDFLTGWGVFDAASAALQINLDATDGRGTHVKEIQLAVGQTNSWLVYLDGSPFRATVVWSDLPGVPPTNAPVDPLTPMLVNNLDLRVETEDGSQTYLPWILNPDLTNKSEAARSANATTGIDSRNNVEQVFIASPTAGVYRIVTAHSGGLPGGQTPTNQWLSVLTSGDTPISPNIAQLEMSPSTNEFLIEFVCDPGAYLVLETTTDLMAENSWQVEGSLVTEGATNAVLFTPSEEVFFWRFRRQTGD